MSASSGSGNNHVATQNNVMMNSVGVNASQNYPWNPITHYTYYPLPILQSLNMGASSGSFGNDYVATQINVMMNSVAVDT